MILNLIWFALILLAVAHTDAGVQHTSIAVWVVSKCWLELNNMSIETRSSSALFKRAEQLKRWEQSDTNREPVSPKQKTRKIKFSSGCVFLAACAAGDKEEVLRLLQKGADINTANVDGLTALHQVHTPYFTLYDGPYLPILHSIRILWRKLLFWLIVQNGRTVKFKCIFIYKYMPNTQNNVKALPHILFSVLLNYF